MPSEFVSENLCSDFLLATQQALKQNGRGAFRENPSRSLYWGRSVCERWMLESGGWQDYQYHACVFQVPAHSTLHSPPFSGSGVCVRTLSLRA